MVVSLPFVVFSSVMRLVALRTRTKTNGQILSFQLDLLALDEKLSFSCQVIRLSQITFKVWDIYCGVMGSKFFEKENLNRIAIRRMTTASCPLPLPGGVSCLISWQANKQTGSPCQEFHTASLSSSF